MRQAAQHHIGKVSKLAQIQRLDRQIAAAFELRKDIFGLSAFFRQGGQIGQFGLAVPK